MQQMNLVLALEAEYSVQFDPDEIQDLQSIGSFVALIGRKKLD
jgi:acyl carrier protein